jgi:hypothetical protein
MSKQESLLVDKGCAEREACAKLCESHVRYPSRLHFAAAIRARGQA